MTDRTIVNIAIDQLLLQTAEGIVDGSELIRPAAKPIVGRQFTTVGKFHDVNLCRRITCRINMVFPPNI
jgi:hypothetical protein